MNNECIKLEEFAETRWKQYSLYTLEERALPSMIDGLKPSQRFIIYSALKNAKDKFVKIVELCGPISSYGYHHGEASANDAAILMAQAWNNNCPLLESRGNFGSRMIQEAAAPRYIFAKLHSNFYDIFADTDLAPAHDDPEVKIPKYYLPIIPFVLLNGIRGTATGFATNILPYDLKDIIKLCKDHISGKNISSRSLTPSYPNFRGKIEKNEKDGWDLVGTFQQLSKTNLVITELPFQYDRESYIEILDDLEDRGVIVGYKDQCDQNGFKFSVTLSRNFNDDIEKTFKLRKSVVENLNVIGADGTLKEYASPIDLIKDFCDFRLSYVQKRIDHEIKKLKDEMSLLKSKITFIEYVLENRINFKGKNKNQLRNELLNLQFIETHVDHLLNMNFYHLTKEEIEKIEDKYLSLNDRLKYLKSTTSVTEYGLDLDNLLKKIKR